MDYYFQNPLKYWTSPMKVSKETFDSMVESSRQQKELISRCR